MSADDREEILYQAWKKSAERGRLPSVQKMREAHPAYWPTYQACLTARMVTYPLSDNAQWAREETITILLAWPDSGERWGAAMRALQRVHDERATTPAAP